jgi:hypothetical protein
MKQVLFFSLMTLSSIAAAGADWKVVATVSDPACAEKIQILAKEGEKFVYAVNGADKNKLLAEDGSTFSADSMKSTTFVSDAAEKRELGDPTYTFTHPSYVEANPPKLDIAYSGVMKHCRMNIK